METALFNFASKAENKNAVYSTALISILVSTASLSLLMLAFSSQLADLTDFEDHRNFIVWTQPNMVES